ncbi:MAG: HAMP domain-containing sensor histidine kinase [Nitriliruptor sp.]
MSILEVLQWTQALLFITLAVAALSAWRRHRTAPAAYVAGAFGVLAAAVLNARISELIAGEPPEFVSDLAIAAIVSFPWLLAAFAWSFAGRLPTWLKAAGVLTLGLGLLAFVVPPLGEVAERGPVESAYVGAILALWAALTLAAAVHLWRAGRGQPVVRARTRLLALGALVLALALVVAGLVPDDNEVLPILIALATIVSAVLFAAGSAPPAPLRLYWRQLPAQRMHEMQTALVAALTPHEAAEAVVPVLADTFGGGATCLDPSGAVAACCRLPEEAAAAIVDQLRSGATEIAGVQVLAVDGWWLAVQGSPYAPLFGEDERDLLERFGLQLRLAVQRAELFVAHGRAREEVEEASRDLQAMLVGLAHDLRSPAVTISTYAALLPDAEDDDRDQMLEGLRDGSAYLDRLVDGLLALSRVGRNDGEPEPVDLGEVVSGVARRLAASFPGLDVRVLDALPVLCLDRLRIEQVVDNLLGNAAKHGGREDLRVEVSWDPSSSGGGVLRFADDGRGVSEDEREAVFALFRRGTTSAAGSGVGLGLVRRIIENHGGRVRLAPSDRGACVEITLPEDLVVTDDVDATPHRAAEVIRPTG